MYITYFNTALLSYAFYLEKYDLCLNAHVAVKLNPLLDWCVYVLPRFVCT